MTTVVSVNFQSSAESHVTQSRPRSNLRVKHRRNFHLPDTKKQIKANSSPQKPLHPSNPNLTSKSMPSSNQLALYRLQNSRSCDNNQATSPLEELNPNRIKRPKTSQGKREPEPFPIQDDCQITKSGLKSCSPNRFRRVPAPFPMTTAYPSRSLHKHLQSDLSATSPSRSQVSRSKENSTRVPQRFPLDSPSTRPLQCSPSDEDDENDELALTGNDANAILTYGGPRPFPMVMSECLPESAHQASVSKRYSKNNNEQRPNKRSRP